MKPAQIAHVPGPTEPISLRRAAALLRWGDSRAAEARLRLYVTRRVRQGAPDPRLPAGRRQTVTLRRLCACLPELDSLQWGFDAPKTGRQLAPNQLLTLIRQVVRSELKGRSNVE